MQFGDDGAKFLILTWFVGMYKTCMQFFFLLKEGKKKESMQCACMPTRKDYIKVSLYLQEK